ncbi:response regulator [Geobacter sp. SVR]|uniref:response regulator n=1 Tax=Geobacter sp. SVR TaxID=2495594 RepID=UPI00143EFAC4|nr:response regulator [Geobacter sp. SVR]BCS54839.1 hypothetical protein GSVR_31470 [Geobacter sp. SVR]GCF86353.1 hypothetical protein GSbR_29530 [Geobacter sp. SVR]
MDPTLTQTEPCSPAPAILVAEDDTDVRTVISKILSYGGYRVIEAENGEEAVAKFIQHKDAVRLVVMDVIMPKKNGDDAYLQMRRQAPDVRVLFVTGYPDHVISGHAVPGDRINLMKKPFTTDELLQQVGKMLPGEGREDDCVCRKNYRGAQDVKSDHDSGRFGQCAADGGLYAEAERI